VQDIGLVLSQQPPDLPVALAVPRSIKRNCQMILPADRLIIAGVRNHRMPVTLQLRNFIFKALVFPTANLVVVVTDQNFQSDLQCELENVITNDCNQHRVRVSNNA
jgi:hypothetical protein